MILQDAYYFVDCDMNNFFSLILNCISEVAELKIAKGFALQDILTELHVLSHRSE